MRYSLSAAALFAASVSADLCAHGSTDDNGNFYCQEVKAITYQGVGGSASYNKVTNMDGSSGSCSSTPHGYSGSLAPFDEEVSLHFRGPLKLAQLAAYVPCSKSSKAKAKRSAHDRRHIGKHAHSHGHLHKKDPALGDLVHAIIDGKPVTWSNDWSGGASAGNNAPAAPPSNAPPSGSPAAPANQPPTNNQASSSPSSSSPPPSNNQPSSDSSSSSDDDDETCDGGWKRIAYYNAENQTADGLVFLSHNGGSGSGVFDYTFGNSLSYASSDGCKGASSPQVLADCTIPSKSEVVVMSDRKCSDDGSDSCGYYRPGTVAYHGFDGPSKAFFVEFSMPDDGTTGASKYDPTNMPAFWMLNAQIPRTLQYGNKDCSCWGTGCGEFDIFEVLAPGDKRCKSTIHGNIAGGDSDYFARPTSGTIKAVVLLYNDNFHIKVLDDSTCFEPTMDDSFMTDICNSTMENSLENLISLFSLSS